MSSSAFAQAAAAEAQGDEAETTKDIVITGSRISTAGFDAPTPTTVIGVAELRQAGRTDIQASLADLPQFRMTQSATSTNTVTSSGQSPADLRGLGSSRTLVLINGRRYVSSGDLQTVPYSLVRQIDVVTGGASAAWGSDAVAGVVNIVLDDDFTGVSLGAQTGVSSRGDAEKYLFNAAFGTKITDRWHVMIGGDYLKDKGIIPATSRPRIAATALFVNPADGKLYPTQDVRQADRSLGGLIIGGPAAGLTFNDNSSLRPFVFGRRSGSTMVGGEGYNADFIRSLSAPIERGSVFVRTSYEVTDNFKLWAEGAYNKVSDKRVFFPDLGISQTQFSYSIDNPFLPAATRAQLVGLGVTSTFNMTRVVSDIALADYDYSRVTKQASVGFDGSFGNGKWRYNGFYSHGTLKQDQTLTNLIKTAEFRNAIDAVRNPAGQIVCRIALTDPTTPCRPLNLFGQGNADPAAVAYIQADWNVVNTSYLDNAGLNISGEPFTLWDKPVSVAAGIEYREQAYQTVFDPVSVRNGFATINGIPRPKIGNNVKEAFAEIAIPVLANLPFAQDLTFNGAARVSDYSTASKKIWSWKLGGVWQVIDDLKLRVSRSRDIRAPSLTDLFSAPGTLFTSVQDISQASPANPAGPTVNIVVRNGGNPNLAPETADTWVAGVVLTPTFIPGLQVSADYYDISIDGAITSLTGQQTVNSCYVQLNQGACSQIIRNSAGTITDINGTLINLASYKTKGVDFEASYRTRLDSIGLPGQLNIRALVNYVDSLVVDSGILVVQGAGYAGTSAAYLTPKWRANASFTYESSSVGGDLRLRWLDESGFAPSNLVANLGNFSYKAATYVDLTLRTYVSLGESSRDRLTFYTSVSNLFDKKPPIGAVSSPYYDLIGRYFTFGVRADF